MLKAISRISIIAVLAILAFSPSQVYAQSMPAGLQKELEKKFSSRKLTASKYTQNGNTSVRKGPYVYKNYFNLKNASPLGGAAKRLRKYCEKKQEGSFVQIAQILPDYKLSVDPITITENGKSLSLTAADIFFLSGTSNVIDGPNSFASNDGWPASHALKYEKLSREKKLGIFNCQDNNGSVLWTTSIIPDQYYTSEPGLVANSTLYNKQIAVLPLDTETIETFKNAKASLKMREATQEQVTADAKAQIQTKILDFRATADVGSETNCGMIIQNRRQIFEIDLKSDIAKQAGKSTAWVKAEGLFPADSTETCYIN